MSKMPGLLLVLSVKIWRQRLFTVVISLAKA